MKTISTKCQITSLSSRNDGSLRLSVVTPELSVLERSEFMELQNQLLQVLFTPEEFQTQEMVIDKDLDGKSPSTRLRSIMFVWFSKLKEKGEVKDDFSLWYRNKMESIMDKIKLKLEDLE